MHALEDQTETLITLPHAACLCDSVPPAEPGEGQQRIMHPRPSPAWPPCTAQPSRWQEACAPWRRLLIENLVKVLPACPRLPIHLACVRSLSLEQLLSLEIHSAPSPPGLASFGQQPATAQPSWQQEAMRRLHGLLVDNLVKVMGIPTNHPLRHHCILPTSALHTPVGRYSRFHEGRCHRMACSSEIW